MALTATGAVGTTVGTAAALEFGAAEAAVVAASGAALMVGAAVSGERGALTWCGSCSWPWEDCAPQAASEAPRPTRAAPCARPARRSRRREVMGGRVLPRRAGCRPRMRARRRARRGRTSLGLAAPIAERCKGPFMLQKIVRNACPFRDAVRRSRVRVRRVRRPDGLQGRERQSPHGRPARLEAAGRRLRHRGVRGSVSPRDSRRVGDP